MAPPPVLTPDALARYADAIVRASLGVTKDDSVVIQGEPAHRELMVAVAAAAYRAGARHVESVVADPLVARARLEHGSDAALGAVSPWTERRLRELAKPTGAHLYIAGESEPGYLDGIPPKRIATDYARAAKATRFSNLARLNMRSRWTIAGWPTDHWAKQVYPRLSAENGKRRLAQDLLWFCRLTDEDGKGASGWLKHVRALTRRSERLTKLALTQVTLRGPGTDLRVRIAPNTRWLGGREETPFGVRIAPNMPTEETFTSPDAKGTEGTFTCTFPLSFRGRLITGLRGEFRGGRLVRLEADSDDDRDFVANYVDNDPNGRLLGEVALVDSSSRIGQSRRVYYHTLLDENAAAHIAFGSGFGGARTGKPARGVNRSSVHLDVMIGGPELEVTGTDARGRAVPLIDDGLWRI
ncbi:MAG TPA: aminopeptidase [Gaiellaceae bacterium]|nr:aminopeptidase [Gaiellaceae bacterium]